jgi:hypothetical protein
MFAVEGGCVRDGGDGAGEGAGAGAGAGRLTGGAGEGAGREGATASVEHAAATAA